MEHFELLGFFREFVRGGISERIETLRKVAEVISSKGELWKVMHQDKGDALLLERDPSRLD